jgi:hypothetical protein
LAANPFALLDPRSRAGFNATFRATIDAAPQRPWRLGDAYAQLDGEASKCRTGGGLAGGIGRARSRVIVGRQALGFPASAAPRR